MVITRQVSIYFTAIAFYISLVLSDLYLYKDLSILNVFLLSLFRFFLIAIPLWSGLFLIKNRTSRCRIIIWILWIFFLPYTIYSTTEIRHVSEICRLTTKLFYTESCVANAWHLLPLLTYALAGTLVFVFSIITVCSHFVQNSMYKRLCIIAACFYTAFASVFGLFTRINMWDIFLKPTTVISAMRVTMSQPMFFQNVIIFTLFFITITFVVRRTYSDWWIR